MTEICVLWRLRGVCKDLECVLYEEHARLTITVERGPERERFWSFPTRSVVDAISLSASLRTRLVNQGWTVLDVAGEAKLATVFAA